MANKDFIGLLKTLNAAVESRFKAHVKGVFGSYTRGEQQPGSDLDVVVEFKTGATLLDFVGLGMYLEEELGVPVDVVPIDAIRVEFKDEILRETIPV